MKKLSHFGRRSGTQTHSKAAIQLGFLVVANSEKLRHRVCFVTQNKSLNGLLAQWVWFEQRWMHPSLQQGNEKRYGAISCRVQAACMIAADGLGGATTLSQCDID
jgi:hypothetical protein